LATKNLARTVVEGGRDGYSKLDRKRRNRAERRLRFDDEGDVIAGRPRLGSWRGFADRLSPLERWLDSQVGRGWTNVYSDFCAKHDRRTMKGWHLFDHMINDVGRGGGRWTRYLVDDRGILRRRARDWSRRAYVSPERESAALTWAGGRLVIVHESTVFWTARAVDPKAPATPQGRRLTLEESAYWSALPAELRDRLTYRKKP
jgi:hypothetical protein